MKAPLTTLRLFCVLWLAILSFGLPAKAQCTVGYINFNAYTAVIGGAISGEDIYRTSILEASCTGECFPYNVTESFPVGMTLAGSGTYPIPANLITSNGTYSFTIPASYTDAAFDIPFNNTNAADHDRTGTLTISGGCPPTGGGQYDTATITLLNTNSTVSVFIVGVSTNYSSSNTLACGVNGSSNCLVRFYRNTAYEARTINYTVSGTYQSTNYSASTPLSGTITIPSGATNADVTLSATNWAQQANNTNTIIITLASGYYKINSAAKSVTNVIIPDLSTIAVYASSASAARGESTSSLVFYKTTPYYANSGARKINFSTSGSAVNGTDYTLSSSSPITIAAGAGAATNTLTPKTESSLNGTKIMTGTVSANAGMYTVSSTNNSATVGVLEDAPLISVAATAPYAYQNASPGTFTLTREDGLPFSLPVSYTLTGTAVNGTDYSTLPTTVTFASNQTSTNLTVTPTASPLLTSAKTVVLNISPGSLYYVGTATQDVVTLLPQSASTNSVALPLGRYWRGSGTDPTYWSMVVPQDFEMGTVYSNVNGNCGTLYAGLTSWSSTNYYHYNATNTLTQSNSANRIEFNNPIAAFGERVGGTPLYLDENYSFGIYAGDPKTQPVTINVYARSNYSFVGSITLTNPSTTNLWVTFSTNGFLTTASGYGLTTIMSTSPDLNWGATQTNLSSFILTHTASAAALNYYYVVQIPGWPVSGSQPMAQDINGTNSPSMLYSLEFESQPTWRATYIDQPHFDGSPLPPFYAGMTIDEILTNAPLVTNSVSLSPSACTNIDDSPELRENPILDQFVASLGNDPVALANYVINQIDLVDGMDYDDDGNVAEQSINVESMSRGALGTFLEKQGNPIEQCALLVYLLREAGVPATYMFAPHDGMMLADERLSRMLKFQVQGDFTQAGEFDSSTNTMIAVNYPWVAAYIGTNWVHIFPWMKDYLLTEGYNLWDYMPSNYPSAFEWTHDYIYGDTNLLSLAVNGDSTPRIIFPAYVKQTLLQNYPTLSLNDLGTTVRNRQHYYARWSDFPQPTWLTNVSYAVESMSSPAVTNVDPRLTNVFDTVSVEVYSLQDPHKDIQTGPLRLVDLHNRQFYITQTNSATNQWQLSMILLPFRTNVTTTNAYTNDSTLLSREVQTMTMDQFDDQLSVRFRYYHNQTTGLSYPIDPFVTFLDYDGTQDLTLERPMRKGDLAAICMNYGRVTRNMLNVHQQDLWNMEATLRATPSKTNSVSTDVYQGAVMYLAGMSYYEKLGEFDATNAALHKVDNISTFAMGLSKISPHRNSSGSLYNSGVDPILPNVDMFLYITAYVGNDTTQPNSGQATDQGVNNYALMSIVDGSAEEHQAINTFYNQTNAVSTVRLLQLAQSRGLGIVPLDYYNYASQGATSYQGQSLQSYDSYVWESVTSAFQNDYGPYTIGYITPGPITNASYSGLGAFIFQWNQWEAIISPSSLNGAFGDNMPDGSVSANNTLNYNLSGDDSGGDNGDSGGTDGGGDGPVLTLQQPATGSTLIPDESASFNEAQMESQIAAGTYTIDPLNTIDADSVSALLGVSAGTADATAAADLTVVDESGLLGNTSDAGAQIGTRSADPVNTITGEFYVNDTDLQLPGPIPLSLRRNYSSQNLADNQFGAGWKLSIMPYLSVGTNATNIYAADMDGAVLAYVQATTNTWMPTLAANPLLDNNTTTGVGGLANRLRDQIVETVQGGTTNYTLYGADGSVRVFKVVSFNNGVLNQVRPYLQTWTDNRGNYYAFSYGTDPTRPTFGQVTRIQCSNGNFLGFDYDWYGHIIDAYSGDGRWMYYFYNEYGDLTGVIFPDGTSRQYQYELGYQSVTNGSTVSQQPYSTHLLNEVDNPDGRVLQNAYDSQRRVTNQFSTVGSNLNPVLSATFIYSNNFNITNSPTNAISGTTWTVDGRNYTNRYDYSNTLITLITDPLGQTFEQIWYPDSATAPGYPRSVYQRKDKRGLWSQFEYDGNGNVTNTVITGDLTGDGITNQTATNTALYNSNCLVLQMTNAAGNSVAYVYDAVYPFLPDQIIRSAGGVPIVTNMQYYGAATNVVTLGSVTQTNVALGLPVRCVRAYNSPDAATNDMAYTGEGFLSQTIRYTGTTDPSVTNTYFVNERGETIDITNAAGDVTEYEYDDMDRKTSEEDFDQYGDLLSSYLYYYDDNGEINWIDGPRFNPEDYVFYDYDGAGRVTTELDWRSQAQPNGGGVEAPSGYNLYAQSFHQFDVNGNELLKVDPRGAMTTNTYDPLNRRIQSQFIDVDGVTVLSTVGLGYEPGGEVAYETNGLGGVSYTQYTTTGKPEYQSLPSGATNGWRFYLDGRAHRRYLGNGSYWDTTYNDVSLLVTNIFYATGGVPQATNMTGMDRRGNKNLFIDEDGNAFTALFDGLDRMKYQLGPLVETITSNTPVPTGSGNQTNIFQQNQTNFYDAAGLAVTNVNGLGEEHIVYFDAIHRPVEEQFRDASNNLVRQATASYSTDHQSVTVVSGTGATAVTNTIYTDNAGKPVLTIGYPSASVEEFILRQYDFSENLVLETHNSLSNGAVTQWTSCSNTFDGLNRITSKTDRDGALTLYGYDTANNRTNMVMPGGLIWRSSYNSALQRMFDYDIGSGGSVTRSNSYTYYSTTGLLQTSTDGRGVTCTHYFDAFLRPATNAYSGPLPEHNLTTVFSYEPRSLLTNIAESFASTNTGPAVNVFRAFDAYGELSQENINGANSYGAGQSWDASGRRGGLGLPNFGYSFGFRADGLLSSVASQSGGASYSYDLGGLIQTRDFSPRVTTVNARDGAGRPTSVTTKVNGVSTLTESLSFTPDGLLSTHTVGRPDFTDNRSYTYASQSRRLTQEITGISSGTNWTNAYVYDKGVAGGPGVMTSSGQAVGTNVEWNGGTDAFSRVGLATNSVAQRQAHGFLNGQATLTALLDGNPMPVTIVGTNDNYQWWAQLQLTPGPHQLVVNALNWSGYYTASATNTFTNNAADRVVNGYGGNGEITNRVWISSNGQTNATETLSFDARDRLHSITHLDSNTNGYNWSAAYDGYGRRLSTTTIYITNGVWLTNLATSIGQFYDPQSRFLELGEMDSSGTTWKIYGPDANGVYGGMQGAGGLEAVVNGPRAASAVVSDARGNGLALYSVSQASLSWFPSRETSYGAVPGYAPLPLTDGAKIAQSSAWHDKWPDATGYYSLGKRVLDPISHTWLSADPLGHDADPSLLTFCGGDPVNTFDPDGRCSESDQAAPWQNYIGQIGDETAADALARLGISGGYANVSADYVLSYLGMKSWLANDMGYSTVPSAPVNPDVQWGGQWLIDAALNGVQQDIANYGNADSSGWGLAYGVVNTVKLGADVIGAVGNVITVGELAVVENGLKAGATQIIDKAVTEAAAQAAETSVVRQATAYNFYQEVGWSDQKIASHMSGIDFSQPVQVTTLQPGTQIVQYQIPGAPIGNYFAPVGTSANTLGIYTSGLQQTTYLITEPTTVLQSTAASTLDTWSMSDAGWNIQVRGGGTQYFMPGRPGLTPAP